MEPFWECQGGRKDWERERRGERKRESDDENIESLARSSRRTTRSQAHSSRGSAAGCLDQTCWNQRCRQRHLAVTNGIGHIAQAEAPSANTQFPFSETDSWNGMVKCWAGPVMVDEAPSLRFSKKKKQFQFQFFIFYLCSLYIA